jgi:hypothetical protein
MGRGRGNLTLRLTVPKSEQQFDRSSRSEASFRQLSSTFEALTVLGNQSRLGQSASRLGRIDSSNGTNPQPGPSSLNRLGLPMRL